MKFTDIFVRRPVLAVVVSLLLLVLGLRSFDMLPVRQFPHIENAVVTVSTTYYGADPDLVAGFITTPLENAISQAGGIDYITSTSTNGSSTITATLHLNYDSNKALTEISTKISAVLNQLPPQSQRPVISVKIGQTISAMYLGFSSTDLSSNKITDYLMRVVQPRLQAIDGVQTARLLGAKPFAMRVWLDPAKLAAYHLTATDVSTALAANDFISGLGATKGQMLRVGLTASTGLHSLAAFRQMVVKQENGAIVRLADIARVTLGAENYTSQVAFDGNKAVYIGIQVAPSANLLDVVQGVRKIFPSIRTHLPQGIDGKIVYDSTKFVDSSIHEVSHTLIEALLIVALVVFLFLGSMRSVLIPVLAIPLSLIGTFTMMLIFGFTINLLTLLAFVLAIGLVVDDAIIVVENVNRHLESGMQAIPAAIAAARELGGPIIAMTAVLIAVYVPVGFQSGLTGALFTEFAFTLVGAVTISAIIALTLSPMMCSRLLKPHNNERKTVELWIDQGFEHLHRFYARILSHTLHYLPVTAVFSLLILASIYFLYGSSKQELAPREDQGVLITAASAAPNSTLLQREPYAQKIYSIFSGHPETDHVFQLDVPGRMIAGMVLKPWDQRQRTASDLQGQVQGQLSQLAGVRVAVFQPSPLPGGRGLPVQFVIGTTQPFEQLDHVSQNFIQQARKSGMFAFLSSDLRIDMPQATVEIDRNKAALLGLNMQQIGKAMASMLGGAYVNYFGFGGRSYKVIPQVQQQHRLNADQLLHYYIHTADGNTIPLSTIAHITTATIPESLNHFQQMNSATIQGVILPHIPMGDALEYLKKLADRTLPQGYSIDYGGQSRQFVHESSGFLSTFIFALIIIFLVLAALFESFRDPLIILVSVPMSIAGALIFITLGVGGASMNIYTQVGLVTLMGLISKHGILIVEFANKLQAEGKSKRQAIEQAAAIRLRPILMTTAAMVLGVLPLVTASGAGAVSRFNMGLVISTGIAIGTVFTLLVVPAMYMLIAKNAQHREN